MMVPMSEPTGRMPAYMRIYSDLRSKMKSTKYPVGSFLPTEPELEQIYGVSRTTIRRAVALLAQNGLVRVTQGRGTEVIAPPPYEKFTNVKSISAAFGSSEDVQSHQLAAHDIAQISIDTIPAKENVARALGVQPNSPLYRLQRLMCLEDGRPVALLVNLLPPSLVPNFQSYSNMFTDLYTFLDETYGVRYLSSEEHVTAKSATLLEANTLNVEVGSPLLYCRRISQCDRGPMEYAYSTYVPDLHAIVINMDVRDYALV